MAKDTLRPCLFYIMKIKRHNKNIGINEDLVRKFYEQFKNAIYENQKNSEKLASILDSDWGNGSNKDTFTDLLIKIDLQSRGRGDEDQNIGLANILLNKKMNIWAAEYGVLTQLDIVEAPVGLKLVSLSALYDHYNSLVSSLDLSKEILEALFKNVIVSLAQGNQIDEILNIFIQMKKPLQDIIAIISKDGEISKEEVEAIYKAHNNINSNLYKYIASILCDGTVNPANQDQFFNFLVEIDIEYQSYREERDFGQSYFLPLLKYKLSSLDFVGSLWRLLSSDEDQTGPIDTMLESLLGEYKGYYNGLENFGVETLGQLDFVYELFKQSVFQLILEHNNGDMQNQKLAVAMDSFLQAKQVEYKLDDDIEYRSFPFAEKKNTTLSCEVNQKTIGVLKSINITECDEFQVRFNTDNIDVQKYLGLLVKFAKVATSLECINVTAGAAYIIASALRGDKLVNLSFIGMKWGNVHMEELTPLIMGCSSLNSLRIEDARISLFMDIIFRGVPGSNLENISLVNCPLDANMMIMAIDALNRNHVLRGLKMDRCELVTAHAAGLISSTFSDTTNEMYNKMMLLGMPEDSLVRSFASTYAPGDTLQVPGFIGEFSDGLFFHMLRSMFKVKYNVDAPIESSGSLQIWLKGVFINLEELLPLELPELTQGEEAILHAFRKFIPKDEPLKSKYVNGEEGAIPVAKYFHPILERAQEFSRVNEFPILAELVEWMLEDIYFQRGVRIPTESMITKLSIAGNQMYEFAAAICSIILVCYPYLEELDISDSEFGDEGAEALAAALKLNESLGTLYIRNNGITDAGGKMLAIALKENNALTALDISLNEISDLILRDIEGSLNRNLQLLNAIFEAFKDFTQDDVLSFNQLQCLKHYNKIILQRALGAENLLFNTEYTSMKYFCEHAFHIMGVCKSLSSSYNLDEPNETRCFIAELPEELLFLVHSYTNSSDYNRSAVVRPSSHLPTLDAVENEVVVVGESGIA